MIIILKERQGNTMTDFLKKLRHLYLHPVDGFDELKHKDDGSVLYAGIMVLLFFIASIAERQFTAFRFNNYNVNNTNIFYIFISTVVVFFFFCIANWSFTAVFDGEGNFKQIFIVTAYSLLPYSLAMLISTGLSYVMSVEESAFIKMVITVGMLYTVLLIYVSMMQIHSFGGVKNLFSLFVTVIGIFVILFLCFLLVTLFQQIFSFFSTMFEEVMMRFTA